jgi:hypothetical protein
MLLNSLWKYVKHIKFKDLFKIIKESLQGNGCLWVIKTKINRKLILEKYWTANWVCTANWLNFVFLLFYLFLFVFNRINILLEGIAES